MACAASANCWQLCNQCVSGWVDGYTYIHTYIHTYIQYMYVHTVYIHTYIQTRSDNVSRLVASLNSNYNHGEQLATAHLVSLHWPEAWLRDKQEVSTVPLKRHGACSHSGVVMSREELTLCAGVSRGGGCRSASGAVSCGQARELSMTSAHSQTHTKAMSSHLYYAHAHAHASDQTVLLCVYVECTEQTQQDYVYRGCGQSRQTRGASFTEELKSREGCT